MVLNSNIITIDVRGLDFSGPFFGKAEGVKNSLIRTLAVVFYLETELYLRFTAAAAHV